MKFYVKIHSDLRRPERTVVAICDRGIINKKLKGEGVELKITERFYKGELKDSEETKKIIKTAQNLNLVGEGVISLAKEIIEIQSVKIIQGVPIAQIV